MTSRPFGWGPKTAEFAHFASKLLGSSVETLYRSPTESGDVFGIGIEAQERARRGTFVIFCAAADRDKQDTDERQNAPFSGGKIQILCFWPNGAYFGSMEAVILRGVAGWVVGSTGAHPRWLRCAYTPRPDIVICDIQRPRHPLRQTYEKYIRTDVSYCT